MQQHRQKAKDTLILGALYVVATPIGNLADISLRALAALEAADVICAEDTRVTAKLLRAYGLHVPLISLREHNEQAMAEKVIERLKAGEIVVQVSDAGTPAVCDPGARLVAAVRAADLPVFSIPGASAVLCALSASGIVSDDFYFGGFLPAKKNEREKRLQELWRMSCPVIVYETPHRILDTIDELCLLPERTITLARELTKTFETFITGSATMLSGCLKDNPDQVRGEMVLIFHADEKSHHQENEVADFERLLHALAEHLPTKQATQIAMQVCDGNKKDLYNRILEIKNSN